MGDNTTNCELY